MIHYKSAKIQLLDLPGIIEGASEGKGRGRQVISVAKSSDLVLMVLDAAKNEAHKTILTRELEAVGIRLNKEPPKIHFKRKKTGGLSFSSTVPLTHLDETLCGHILREYRIHNADVLLREDATADDLIDVIEGNRKYVRCLYVYNKIDVLSIEEVDELAHLPHSVPISCVAGLGRDALLAKMWETMDLRRVYSKPIGGKPDFEDPVMLSAARGGATVGAFCGQLHADLSKQLAYAMVWGTSSKHYPQRCGSSHMIEDEDVISIVKKKTAVDGTLRGRFRTEKAEPLKICDREKKKALRS